MDLEPEKPEGSIRLALYEGAPRPCPYLPGRTAVDAFTVLPRLDPGLYQLMMDAGYRRSGTVVYRPVCTGCRECVPLRVPVERFERSRSQERVWRRNIDIAASSDVPQVSEEKWRMYLAYLRRQHDGTMSEDYEDFRRFLYESPTETIEMEYRISGRLAGVGIVDVCPDSLSSVYFYFDPEFQRRSLGVYSMLCEIDACLRRGLPYWYAGFFVRGCRKMEYKGLFRPHQLLGEDGVWRDPRREPGQPEPGWRGPGGLENPLSGGGDNR